MSNLLLHDSYHTVVSSCMMNLSAEFMLDTLQLRRIFGTTQREAQENLSQSLHQLHPSLNFFICTNYYSRGNSRIEVKSTVKGAFTKKLTMLSIIVTLRTNPPPPSLSVTNFTKNLLSYVVKGSLTSRPQPPPP